MTVCAVVCRQRRALANGAARVDVLSSTTNGSISADAERLLKRVGFDKAAEQKDLWSTKLNER